MKDKIFICQCSCQINNGAKCQLCQGYNQSNTVWRHILGCHSRHMWCISIHTLMRSQSLLCLLCFAVDFYVEVFLYPSVSVFNSCVQFLFSQSACQFLWLPLCVAIIMYHTPFLHYWLVFLFAVSVVVLCSKWSTWVFFLLLFLVSLPCCLDIFVLSVGLFAWIPGLHFLCFAF